MGGCCCKRGEGLYDACQRNDEAAALRLIEQQSSTGFKGQVCSCATAAACTRARTAQSLSVLRHAHDCMNEPQNEWTALHAAALHGNEAVVVALCRAGANVDVQDKVRRHCVQTRHWPGSDALAPGNSRHAGWLDPHAHGCPKGTC